MIESRDGEYELASLDKVVNNEKSYRERIISAAYSCFGRFSYSKTALEDIAREAGLSRPTIYKFFKTKGAIFEQICCLECRKLSEDLREHIDKNKSTSDKIVDTIIFVTRHAMENVYLRRGVEAASFSSRSQISGSVLQQEYVSLWRSFIEKAVKRGDLASDLTTEEMVHWIVANEGMLMMRLDAEKIEDGELRRLVSRLIVYPLLPLRTDREKIAISG